MNEQKKDSGKMERLVFCRNADDSKEKPENGKLDFTVMINPDSISRVLSLSTTLNESMKSKDKGDAYDCNPETISFTFYLDRTNVVPKRQTRHDNQSVDEMIEEFLKVVYKNSSGNPVQVVAVKYGLMEWIVRTNSITIEHSLFDRNGNTLRAKISCSFMTVKDNKPKTPKNTKKKSPKKKSQTNLETDSNDSMSQSNCLCICPDICEEARTNNQNSLYSRADANYLTSDGQAKKV